MVEIQILFTWNVGIVERISMMIDESKNSELTITRTWSNNEEVLIEIVKVPTLAAEEEFGSSNRVQMTLLSLAQHNPSK